MKSTANIPALRSLWKRCFDADNAFLDLFFGKGINLCETFVHAQGQEIASALSIFPIEHKGHKGGYVYGVCTDPLQRGHRYAVKLLEEAEQQCIQNNGMEFFILRPATASLFEYYRKSGYSNSILRSRITLDLPMIPADVELCKLTPERFHQLRRRFYYDKGLFEWPADTCSYILSYICYCQGQSVEIMNGESYLLSYPDPDDNDTIICEEAGITPGLTDTMLISSAIRALYPTAARAILSYPHQRNGEEYLVCKPVKHLPDKTGFFSFTME